MLYPIYCPEFIAAVVVARAVALAVVAETPVLQLTDEPEATCAKLGCPPCASPASPFQPTSTGLIG